MKKPAKKPAKQQTYIYGNYRNYYGYRIEKGQEEDPRLAVFRKEWFEGKECLDIGCNQGLITLAIAKKFSCRGILGIDIDKVLIGDANRNLRKMARKEQSNSRLRMVTNVSDLDFGNSVVFHSSDGETSDLSSDNHKEDSLVNRVFFREENFVENFHKCSEKYDTILCLSVTKWIHLNCGDDGLITLFVKIWRCLRPGGVLLLEPQPWSSYMKKRKVSDNTNENYWRLEIRPHNFREILLDKIGFRSAEVVTKNLSGSAKGFDRPIIAYYK